MAESYRSEYDARVIWCFEDVLRMLTRRKEMSREGETVVKMLENSMKASGHSCNAARNVELYRMMLVEE